MIETLYFFLGLILAISFLVMLGQRLNISYPIFLVLGGLAISFIPGLPKFKISPDLVFLIFLPPLLYDAAWNTSWKEFWKWRRVISMFAFGLVLITSVVVAFVSSSIIPGFTLSLGYLLGAIISPPDAVAASSVLKGIKIPKRMTAILEGESLMNDATSLIIFRFALVATITSSFNLQEAAVDFTWVVAGGILVGVGIAAIFYSIYRWLPTTATIDVALSLAAPYLMYLMAEHFHLSGVMAVVSGLFLSHRSHQFFNHNSRLQGTMLWSALVFILNGFVFMLIGLELPAIIDALRDYSFGQALGFALIISAVVIVTRILVALGTSAFTTWISKYIHTNDSNPGWKGPVMLGWAGMRGVVSLASALSIPLLLPNGEAFPYRNLILFITFVVILVTLVFQGLTLPAVIRWVNMKDTFPHKPQGEQENEIRVHLLNAMIKALEEEHGEVLSKNELLRNKHQRLRQHIETMDSPKSDERASLQAFQKVQRDLIQVQRQALNYFRDKEEFDDEVIRKIEEQLDLEEAKTSDYPPLTAKVD
jgi:CPA1 family monovalent cation:H+ antiporter